MKPMYWRPRKLPMPALVTATAIAVLGVVLTELVLRQVPSDSLTIQKFQAAQLAEQAMREIKSERIARGHMLQPVLDPSETGLIGEYWTPTTTVRGDLHAKQISVNPNFAALIVEMLRDVGVGEGDLVAAGFSGSFPALNLCVCCAIETLGARPVIISSVGASQFGANIPDFLWIDMERHLRERGLISFGSVAASYGGAEDLALTMSGEGRELISQAIRRNGLSFVDGDDYGSLLDDRMRVYTEHGTGRPKVYINVGGGAVSVGRSTGRQHFQPGLNQSVSEDALAFDSVMTRFARQGIPVIHLAEVRELAPKYGFPNQPEVFQSAGEGRMFYNMTWARGVAVAAVVLVCLILGLGFPIRKTAQTRGSHGNALPRDNAPMGDSSSLLA